MNTRDLPALFFGIGIVCIAYMMKKSGIEAFQAPPMPPTAPPMGAPAASPMAPPPMAPPPMAPPPMAPPPGAMPPGAMPPGAMPPGAMPAGAMPAGAMPPGPPGPTQPAMAMKPNQQQLMDLSTKVQKMASEQGAIAMQLQQMTQSFSESFQSYQNPYNAASPGDTQAMEFRLGKKALIDNVVRY